ncbi:hypothetical protein ACFL2H_12620 [Planctomycetota bacterium]
MASTAEEQAASKVLSEIASQTLPTHFVTYSLGQVQGFQNKCEHFASWIAANEFPDVWVIAFDSKDPNDGSPHCLVVSGSVLEMRVYDNATRLRADFKRRYPTSPVVSRSQNYAPAGYDLAPGAKEQIASLVTTTLPKSYSVRTIINWAEKPSFTEEAAVSCVLDPDSLTTLERRVFGVARPGPGELGDPQQIIDLGGPGCEAAIKIFRNPTYITTYGAESNVRSQGNLVLAIVEFARQGNKNAIEFMRSLAQGREPVLAEGANAIMSIAQNFREVQEQSTEDTIHFLCSSCNAKLSARRGNAGRWGRCPKCKNKNRVPSGL